MSVNEPRPRVDDEDREATIRRVAEAMQGAAYGKAAVAKAGRAVDVLVSERGWGPKPTVSRERLVDHVARLQMLFLAPVVDGVLTINAESMADALMPLLAECGIEVTDR